MDIDAAGQNVGLWAALRQIYARMSALRRRQMFLQLVLLLGSAIAELATIGAIMPFLALLADPRSTLWWLAPRGAVSGHPLILAAVLFTLLAVISGALRIQLARSSRRFTFRLGHDLNAEIQRRVLYQPFSFHIHRNTNSLLTAVYKTEGLVFYVLFPLMHAVSAGLIALFVIALLLFVAPLVTLLVGAAFVLTYAFVTVIAGERLAASSAILDRAYDDRMQVVQESLGGIRDVIIDNSQPMYLQEFSTTDSKLADARWKTEFVSIAPRYLVEIVGIAVIAMVALFAAQQQGGLSAALPMLGALALGAQRLLPLVQAVYVGWSSLEGQRSILEQVVELLALPVPREPAGAVPLFDLRSAIELKQVSFTYPTRSEPALKDVSFSIPSGSMLALVGTTGSGKSTLLDIIMGLLEPTSGRILIDNVPLTPATQRRWHRSIAHVPQSIFLADTTIARNIGLSLPNNALDQDRAVNAAKRAQLDQFVSSLPDGYETRVGERGIRLSGGQRQRLGIARAIYKDTPVLVLDEATSALDEVTESAVIETLDELRRQGRTIIIVAHRASTVRHCDLIARLDHGRLVEFGPLDRTLESGAKQPRRSKASRD